MARPERDCTVGQVESTASDQVDHARGEPSPRRVRPLGIAHDRGISRLRHDDQHRLARARVNQGGGRLADAAPLEEMAGAVALVAAVPVKEIEDRKCPAGLGLVRVARRQVDQVGVGPAERARVEVDATQVAAAVAGLADVGAGQGYVSPHRGGRHGRAMTSSEGRCSPSSPPRSRPAPAGRAGARMNRGPSTAHVPRIDPWALRMLRPGSGLGIKAGYPVAKAPLEAVSGTG